ncbi:MAG: translation initiation factor IF-3 [Candidatus Fonsibacter sp.]
MNQNFQNNNRNNYSQANSSKRSGPRVNEFIRATEVQLIDSDGQNLGIVPINDALISAREQGLDLIEIAAGTKPPVCKITDYGKFKYDLQKKANQAKKKQKVSVLKEIKLRPGTEKHDYDFKMRATEKFLLKGDKVKFTIKLKGREMQHLKLAEDLASKIITDLKLKGKVEQSPKMAGMQMTLVIQPAK